MNLFLTMAIFFLIQYLKFLLNLDLNFLMDLENTSIVAVSIFLIQLNNKIC